MALQLRSKYQAFRNPRFVCHLSSSSDSGDDKNDPPSTATVAPSTSTVTSPPSLSAYFSEIKSKLKESSPPPRVSSSPSSGESFSFASSRPSKPASLEEIRKSLSEFRLRSTLRPPDEGSSSTSSVSSPTISFQDLYKRNVIEKGEGERSGVGGSTSGKLSLEAIRESLKQIRASSENQNVKDRVRGSGDRGSRMLDPMSLMAFRDSLKMKPEDRPNSSVVHGGSEPLPASVFGKELREKTEKESQELKTEFLRTYTYGQLGDKLRKLRPAENKGDKNWFSLSELNQRLVKLREMEEQEASSRISGVSFKDLRECLVKMHTSDSDRAKRSSIQRLDILGQFRGTPSYMMAPPKEHLVEKYFHPDNMSSSEKMKLELKKVRDEFKMSESDCGSARVQVAQLTTKIKHLSSVLHKKDKHSRKGLQAMVQRRKMLLKYLRRTDWDSYCFVLGKLGLRDNPDYKN